MTRFPLTSRNSITPTVSSTSPDPETYDLLYANPAQLLHSQQPPDCQYAGQKCYRLLAGLSAPCSSCPKDKLRRDRFHFRQFHSMRTSKDYLVWNTLISWDNHDCIFSDSVDVDHMIDIHANGRLTKKDTISINDINSPPYRKKKIRTTASCA